MQSTAALFIAFLLATAGAVVATVWKAAGWYRACGTLVALAGWGAYVAWIAHLGLLGRTNARPPGMVFLVGPIGGYFIVAALVLVSARGRRMAAALPLSVLIGAQAFRIGVEVLIHRLYVDGVVPKVLTFGGANVDLYVGLSALIVAFVANRRPYGRTVALVWNVFGLLALVNVVSLAILTAPGPLNVLHTYPPNRMFVTFPYTFIPAFFVPLAVTLHLLAVRAIYFLPQDSHE